MNGYWSLRIANAFIEKSLNGQIPITQFKLQKLCCFANGQHWDSFDEKLISDFSRKWNYGWVYWDLVGFASYQGKNEVTRKISDEDAKVIIQNKNRASKLMDKEVEDECIILYQKKIKADLDYKAKKTIDKVWEECKDKEAYQLLEKVPEMAGWIKFLKLL